MSYSIRILAKAQDDVDRIYVWLYERSPRGAATWFRRFLKARESLRERPERCALAPEDAEFDYSIRELMFKTSRGRRYRILFTIVDDEVQILRVRAPGQDLITTRHV
jgi:plasmid stabilization system protein ParE